MTVTFHGCAAFALCVLSAGLGPALAPHPGHTSYAEVHCNPESRELEVSLAMLGIDFEAALSRREGKRVDLDTTEGIRTIVEDYLADRFVVTLPDGSEPRPDFAGHEDWRKTVWIYFTIPLASKRDATRPTERAASRPTSRPSSRPASRPTRVEPISHLFGVHLENRVLMECNAMQRNTVELREGEWRRVLEFTELAREQVLRDL